MAEFLERRMALASKVEAAEGVAETLTNAEVDLLVYNVKFEADINQFERKPNTPTLSPFASIPGMRKGKITFTAELKGSGTAGTAPKIGRLLKAVGFDEAISPGVSVTYSPDSTGLSSLTIAVYSTPSTGNNLKALLRGARGTVKWAPKVGDPVMLDFEFWGVFAGITDVAGLTATGLETTKPQPMLNTGFTMHGSSHKISTFAIDLGNTLAYRTDIAQVEGVFSTLVTDKNPTFSYDPEKELVATHDFFGKLTTANEGAMSIAIGATAGNICTITAPKAQYTKITEGARDGIAIFNIDGKFNGNAGNDELVLAFT